MFPGRGYNELKLGDFYESAMTMTETHLVLGAGLFGDFNPLHVNQQFASESRFGNRIAHGYLTTSFMAAQLGMVFHGTAIAYVEHTSRFTAPVMAGDTLKIVWTVTALDDKPKHEGGMVSLTGVCTNQHDAKVAEAEAKMLIAENRRD